MSRPPRSERLAAKGRPKRRAAKTHFFKYQLASNPSRAEENDLKRALQESLQEQGISRNSNKSNGSRTSIINSANSSDVSRSNISSSSNESLRVSDVSAVSKRTRSNNSVTPPAKKRTKLDLTFETKGKCDANNSSVSLIESPTLMPIISTKAIRTYSRGQRNDTSTSKQFLNGLQSPTPSRDDIPGKADLSSGSQTIQNGASISNLKMASQSVSKSTQTPKIKPKINLCNTKGNESNTSDHFEKLSSSSNGVVEDKNQTSEVSNPAPIQEQYLKFKRESKNYAYVKMTALKVSTSKSPSSNSKNSKKASPSGVLNSANNTNQESSKTSMKSGSTTNNLKDGSKSNLRLEVNGKKSTNNSLSKTPPKGAKTTKDPKNLQGTQLMENSIQISSNPLRVNDCSTMITQNLSTKINQNQAVAKRRAPQGSWSLLGAPEEKVVYLRDDEPPRRLICYPAIKHVGGDVIQVRDSVLLRSGAKKTDPPYIAKVCSFWEDAETGNVMMSLYWYYRPEHTEDGRKPHHLSDEIFASRHRDVDSVECIEDKCYVLTFNEYCRYRKRCKMEQVNTSWSLTDVTIPLSNESYPRRDRIPDSDVEPELVFCCRQIYDSRFKRLIKNPLINSKYGHI